MSSSGENGRPVVLVSAAMFLLSGGENLWRKFLPQYLRALGAPIRAVGFYGSLEDFLDGIYQYPGGFLGDHLGRRKALLLFVALAMVGYAVYAAAPGWTWAIVALIFAMAWSSMASPTLFAVVGDALPKERRALGFTLQAVLRRVPILFAPILGGLLIARVGVVKGVQILCAVTFVLGALTLVVVSKIRIDKIAGAPANIGGVWRAMPKPLRWLLLSDVFIRTCEGLVDEFVVIWAMSVAGLTAPQYGVLIAAQVATSIAVYLPAAKIADRIGRKPVVVATFLCFSLFPVAVVAASTFKLMIAAFVVGGLREIGEPARKALIVDLAQPVLRARTVGLYYLIRSVAITPAAFVGGLLWERQPSLPFLFAMGVGLFGTLLFALTVDEGGL
ncbi:MAG TPA: MFS transporter [Thermoanaerobaculia bacterium]|nr:MFS transporter [Thermoanaerobaculia bacterium]